ncbi:SAM-dependent methyltransferase [Thioalkalivibrio sp. HK1]|uniref:SAM-dependent methyltransferase n=1 Tax=Thioalkalivibrio sp. HK1 TaxID=1469245 RepID=UPI00046FDD57|nr:cyclopropane-fatty-acyl-phospholipid synthase family protein [Thioalkalivibrio sp. HK1]
MSIGMDFLTRQARRLIFGRLRALDGASPPESLRIVDPLGEVEFGALPAEKAGALLHVRHLRFYRRVLTGGSLAAAESWMDGDWDSDDLTALIRLFTRNIAISDLMEGGMARLAGFAARMAAMMRRNTRIKAKRNIRAHYDLGDDFFALFLDPTRTYSAGIFEHPQATMREASIAKLDRICRKLALSPEHRVIEIGSGWGSFAVHAAEHYGCHITTTTISAKQYEFVRRLIEARKLQDRVRLLQSDYRDLTGEFDKLVSIEMIEAVGHERLPEYFRVCDALLNPQGEALIQAITMPSRRYASYLRSSDFIRHYIFPGSCVPSLSAILSAATDTAFNPVHLEDIGLHYARTLRRWRRAFDERIDEVLAMGFDHRFVRLWRFYLCYCEAGFQERYLGDVQLLLRKPGNENAPILPKIDPEAITLAGEA